MDWVAYFLTFHTYGTRLHGSAETSVDRGHNGYDTPTLPPDAGLERYRQALLSQPPYMLDATRRPAVLAAIVQHAAFRGWTLHTAHVRTTHVHVVVTADKVADRAMDEFKAYASRALAGHDPPGRQRWARHGSTRHLSDLESLAEAVSYTLNEQGERLAWYKRPPDELRPVR